MIINNGLQALQKEKYVNYALDYQSVDESIAFAWENGQNPRRIVLKMAQSKAAKGGFGMKTAKPKRKKSSANQMGVNDFLLELGLQDTVYTELGGQNDKFCIAAFRQGVTIQRLPTFIIADEQKRQRNEEGKQGDQVEEAASILYRRATEKPQNFYQFRETDLPYLEVRMLSNMFYTVQRKIRISTANRLRHLTQDLAFLGGPNGFPIIQQSIESVIETLPAEEQVEFGGSAKDMEAIKFFKNLESMFSKQLQQKLETLPLYNAVFKQIPKVGPGIAGYIIAAMLDIRRFPKPNRLRAYAGYHLIMKKGKWVAAKREKGVRANWHQLLKQAVWFFTFQVNNSKLDNPWKVQLETRYVYEVKKLLDEARAAGKDIPQDMTAESFLSMVKEIREDAAKVEEIAHLPEAYKGIPSLARKRALRWVGQKFLNYIWTEWRRFEGLPTDWRQVA